MRDWSDLGKDFLNHYVDPNYDPQKAREYYLRTRQLKGRPTGAKEIAPLSRTTIAKPVLPKKKASVSPEVRQAQLKAKLEMLKKVLAELVRQSKLRSGVETKTTVSNANKDQKMTGQQRKEAQKRSKEYYQKNKDKVKPAAEDVKDLEKKIQEVTKKIQAMQAKIAQNRSLDQKNSQNGTKLAKRN